MDPGLFNSYTVSTGAGFLAAFIFQVHGKIKSDSVKEDWRNLQSPTAYIVIVLLSFSKAIFKYKILLYYKFLVTESVIRGVYISLSSW